MTDTTLQQLVINVGTTAQIEAGISGGTITSNMLSFATDGDTYLTTGDGQATEEVDVQGIEEIDVEDIQESTIQDLLKTITGYNGNATQTLKNINGTLTWVTD